ncbi:hypothetical protein Uis4E_1699 [Bifidobacterium parmae]|uniref:MarR family transcriptional regulator n=2 Tax=Bifidobacterium parmae TaxID=361854 RepID=A0A2N5IZC4_9BIFI|nr:ABC-three component system middle component 2 [Bifidobacterium parmae]PLS27303.1 hypothetical protein Uis4E_1699 [Bifidobacterium parmae]
MRGLVSYVPQDGGLYALTGDGRRVANAMTNVYAKRFAVMAKKVVSRFGVATDDQLIAVITNRMVASVAKESD